MPPNDDADWSEIRPLIDRLANQIPGKLNMDPLTRRAFLEEVPGWSAELRAKYQPEKGEPGGWFYKCLKNKAIDLIRERSRDRKNLIKLKESAVDGRYPGPHPGDECSEPDEPLPINVIIDMLERVTKPENRMILILEYGIAAPSALGRVEKWVAEADLPNDFPWRDILIIDDDAERRKALAAALNMSMVTLRQRIHRAIEELRETLRDSKP